MARHQWAVCNTHQTETYLEMTTPPSTPKSGYCTSWSSPSSYMHETWTLTEDLQRWKQDEILQEDLLDLDNNQWQQSMKVNKGKKWVYNNLLFTVERLPGLTKIFLEKTIHEGRQHPRLDHTAHPREGRKTDIKISKVTFGQWYKQLTCASCSHSLNNCSPDTAYIITSQFDLLAWAGGNVDALKSCILWIDRGWSINSDLYHLIK